MESLDKVTRLVREGSLDRKLKIRIFIFALIAALCGALVLYDIISYKLHLIAPSVAAVGGFLVGYALLARINPISWDEEREVVVLGRIDAFGIAVIAIYVAIRILTKSMLEEQAYNVITISGVTYASVFGIMVGRLFGMLKTIQRVHSEARPDFEKQG